MMEKYSRIGLFGFMVLVTMPAQAAWVSTPFTEVNIRMDNGVTYFYPSNPAANGSLNYPLGGNCLNSRLELRDTGDRFNSIENARRIMALILSARMAAKRVMLGYDDTDGPACRIAQVIVEW